MRKEDNYHYVLIRLVSLLFKVLQEYQLYIVL